ncbi:uncharacterized protein LOC108735395 [Agrilus planipennis]|uniref:Uncharacterized protein LOC108735395 n=1 Tax=Agrilus planipennis TaxID=224129 RepID=A0A1W4WQU2_AGRPL|nr:uncharacterized protein LOC108735395 [Agrilus planipennis]
MQCDELQIKLSNSAIPSVRLTELDSALHELGMLATCTNSRKEYLNEIHQQNLCKMLKINTRYVSNVSIGFQVRPVTPHVRYKPYQIPKREERHRTKSENNDNEESSSVVRKVVEETFLQTFELAQLKKAKSLENIVAETTGSNFVPEIEVVSNCIEKLKVAE